MSLCLDSHYSLQYSISNNINLFRCSSHPKRIVEFTSVSFLYFDTARTRLDTQLQAHARSALAWLPHQLAWVYLLLDSLRKQLSWIGAILSVVCLASTPLRSSENKQTSLFCCC